MINSEDKQAAIMQAAIQGDIAAVKLMREEDSTTEPHTRRNNQEELHRPSKLDQC